MTDEISVVRTVPALTCQEDDYKDLIWIIVFLIITFLFLAPLAMILALVTSCHDQPKSVCCRPARSEFSPVLRRFVPLRACVRSVCLFVCLSQVVNHRRGLLDHEKHKLRFGIL